MKGSRLVYGSADLRSDAVTGPLLDQFYEAGGRALDVANVYADGEYVCQTPIEVTVAPRSLPVIVHPSRTV